MPVFTRILVPKKGRFCVFEFMEIKDIFLQDDEKNQCPEVMLIVLEAWGNTVIDRICTNSHS